MEKLLLHTTFVYIRWNGRWGCSPVSFPIAWHHHGAKLYVGSTHVYNSLWTVPCVRRKPLRFLLLFKHSAHKAFEAVKERHRLATAVQHVASSFAAPTMLLS